MTVGVRKTEIEGAILTAIGYAIDYFSEGSLATLGNSIATIGEEMMIGGALAELASALSPRPKPIGQSGVIRSTTANMQIVYGSSVKVGGVLTFADVYGTNNEYLVCNVAHSLTEADGSAGMSIGGITDIFIDNVQIPTANINASTGAITAGSDGSAWNSLPGNLKVFRHDGSQTSADSEITGNFSSSEWPSTSIGKGIANTTFEFFASSDQATYQAAYPRGIPQFFGALVNGQRIYDPRQDSTNGGSGSQRLATKSTWTTQSNPALILANYLTRAKSDGGCGFSTSQIDWDSVATAANICDEDITVPAYGSTYSGGAWSDTVSQARYSFNGCIDTGTGCDQNVQIILNHMCGALVPASGKFYIYAGAATDSTGSLDESYLAGPISYTAQVPRNQMFNCVKATYLEPDEDYQVIQAQTIYNSTYETDDGGVRLVMQQSYIGCTDQYSCQTLQIYNSHRTRNKQMITAKLNAKALTFQCFDVVDVTLSEFGLSSAPFRIISWALNPDFTVDVVLLQENSGTWTIDQDEYIAYTPLAYFDIPGTVPTPVKPSSVAASALSSGILLTWTPPADNQYSDIYVYRSTDGGSTYSYYDKCRGASYLDSYTTNGSTYYYKVEALNQFGPDYASGFTSAVSATSKQAATDATKGAVAGTNLYKSDGTTVLGNSDVITNLGTANNTSYVGTTAASTVEQGATYANTGLNSLGQLITKFANPFNVAGVAVDGGSDVDIPLSGLTGKTADLITYTAGGTVDSLKPLQAGASPIPRGAQNIIPQPAPDASLAVTGWCAASANESVHATMYPTNAAAPVMGYFQLQYVDNGRAYASFDGVNPAQFQAEGGETVWVKVRLNGNSAANMVLYILAHHADGSTSYNYTPTGVGSGWNAETLTWQLPSDCVYFTVMIWSDATSGQYEYWSNVMVAHSSRGLTDAGSGVQVGDMRQVPFSITANGATALGGVTLTAPSRAHISIASGWSISGGGVTLSSGPSGSLSGLADSILYYIYADLASPTTLSGCTYGATTSKTTAINGNNRVYLGACTTTNSGGTGGGGTGCVSVDSFVLRRNVEGQPEPIRAGSITVGDWLLRQDGQWECVTYSEVKRTQGVRITRNGHSLTCSESAELLSDAGEMEIAGEIPDAERVGIIWVQHLTLKNAPDDYFRAGDDPSCPFSHHNLKAP